MPSGNAQQEIQSGERFAFGANWTAFLSVLNESRIDSAQQSLSKMLGVSSLVGKRFLDIGSGSGLSSLAAYRLGAEVVSFDFDPQSVACTRELRRRYASESPHWTIEQGSVLDPDFLNRFGSFEVVYSWGVLHHTGQMWKAIDLASQRVAADGQFFIAIYNDEGAMSRFWTRVKQTYCSGFLGRWLMLGLFIPYFAVRHALRILVTRSLKSSGSSRGMSAYYDWIDWLGGYPFEVAKVEELLRFCQDRGFVLENLITTNRLGCNEMVFRKRI